MDSLSDGPSTQLKMMGKNHRISDLLRHWIIFVNIVFISPIR